MAIRWREGKKSGIVIEFVADRGLEGSGAAALGIGRMFLIQLLIKLIVTNTFVSVR